jgi:hypothetical protein
MIMLEDRDGKSFARPIRRLGGLRVPYQPGQTGRAENRIRGALCRAKTRRSHVLTLCLQGCQNRAYVL